MADDNRSALEAWKLVPAEATPAMLHALWAHRHKMEGVSENAIARVGYDNILLASPSPPIDIQALVDALNAAEFLSDRLEELSNEAKKRFTLEDHARATEGVECRKDADVLDETPQAYKDIEAVMAAQADLIDVVHTLKQVVCVKG